MCRGVSLQDHFVPTLPETNLLLARIWEAHKQQLATFSGFKMTSGRSVKFHHLHDVVVEDPVTLVSQYHCADHTHLLW